MDTQHDSPLSPEKESKVHVSMQGGPTPPSSCAEGSTLHAQT